MDGWLCGDCRSLNTPRSKSCYRCNVPRRFGEAPDDLQSAAIVRTGAPGATGTGVPASVAAPDTAVPGLPPLDDLRPGVLPPGAAKAAEARGRPTVADARSSRGRSRVVLVLLALATTWSALTLAMLLARGGTLGLLMDMLASDTGVMSTIMLVSGIGVLLTVLTALAWFWWFDRVLRNVPPLTGQWPDSGRASAIGWWLVPIVGLVKAPRIVGDVYHRLAVEGTPGLWLLGLWVITWIGGTVAPWIAQRVLGFLPLPIDLVLGLSDLISLLSQVSYIVAGVLAIALVLSIEHAQQTRMALGGAAAPRPADGSEADERFQAVLLAAARDNAAAKVAVHGRAPGSAGPFGGSQGAGASATSNGLGLSSAVRPAAGGDPADLPDEPILRPVPRPPNAINGGAAGSRSIVYTASGSASPIPGAAPEDLFTGLPDGTEESPTGRRFGRPARPKGVAVPRLAMGIVVVLVIAGILGGVMLAGPASQRPRSVNEAIDRGIQARLASPTPAPTLPRPSFRAATPAPTPAATPTPEAWVVAAQHLASSTFAQEWTGRMTLDASLRIGDREPITWTLSVARAGTTEWSKRRVVTPLTGPLARETVVLARTVWERENGGEWLRRDRGFGDQPTDPLFGVPDADGLTWQRTFKENGQVRHEFELTGANDLLVLEFLRDAGVTGLARTGATVITDAAGDPLRGEIIWAGTTRTGKAKLVVELTWKDIGGTFTIQSPKDGDPVVD